MTQIITIGYAIDNLLSDRSLFLAGGSGEVPSLTREIAARPDSTRHSSIYTSFLPGVNVLPLDSLHPTARVTALFMQPGSGNAQASGRFRILPLSYFGYLRHLREEIKIDTVVVHLSRRNRDGLYTLGTAAEFMPTILQRARIVIGVVNSQMPVLRNAPTLAPDRLDYMIECDEPLVTYGSDDSDAETKTIAHLISTVVEDNVALQFGLGKIPLALLPLLHDRRGIRLHSGMLTDAIIEMTGSGALDPVFPARAGVLLGSKRLYDWAGEQADLQLRGCEVIHDPIVLHSLDRFIAINSALEIDLYGQCNLEMIGGSGISGVGGAADFARAARLSRGGVSIFALPATTRGGASRIVPALPAKTVCSIPRYDVGIVVTEFGLADLRRLSASERSEALIAIAAPAHRKYLEQSWRDMTASL